MFEKRRQTAALARRLAAAVVVPLTVLAAALLLRPAEESAAALDTAAEHAEAEAGLEIFLIDEDNELIGRKDGAEYLLPAGKKITVYYQDEEFELVSKYESVSDFLSQLELQLSPLEMVAVYSPQKSPEIVIGSELVVYERSSSTAAYETVYQYNSEKPEGFEQVLQEGRDGVSQETYEIVYQDGEEIARQLIDVVETDTVDEIIEKGTAAPAPAASAAPTVPANETAANIISNGDGTGTITLEDGAVVTFSSVRNMRGTAYTQSDARVGSRTASGTAVRRGVVAVDRNVLPLGTRVYVVSNDGKYDYGVAVAEDTGVRGNTIDLYMDSHNECIQFGVRECTVYILD